MRWALSLVVALAFLAALRLTPRSAGGAECQSVVRYKLGSIDPRFRLRPEAFLDSARQAANAWNQAAGQELIVYDENAALILELSFDGRQRKTEGKQQLKALIAQWEQLDATRARLLAAYQQAPDEPGRQQLNSIVSLQNQLREQVNAASRELNGGMSDAESDRIFIEGDYRPGRIAIYAFDSKEQFERVLAHEFGHALGLGHVPDPKAVMHYVHADENIAPLELTEADRAAAATRCVKR